MKEWFKISCTESQSTRKEEDFGTFVSMQSDKIKICSMHDSLDDTFSNPHPSVYFPRLLDADYFSQLYD